MHLGKRSDLAKRSRVVLALAITFTFACIAAVLLGMPAASLASSAPAAGVGSGLSVPTPAPVYGLRQALSDKPDPVSVVNRPVAAVSSGTWQPLGPAPIGPPFLANGGVDGGANSGRITGLASLSSGLHPGRVVAATAGGGIWTSDDNGTTWAPRTDGAADLAIGSVAVDPSNANHLIAGTGEANQCGDCFPGIGILVSTDGGTTWTLQNPGGVFSGDHIGQVAIDPSNANHEFAATDGGLFVTTDGGTSWAEPTDVSYEAVDGNISAVVINPTTPTTVYIGGGAATVARSTDGGVTWAAANTGIATPGPFPLIALAVAPSTPSTLYASVGTENPVAMYKSINGGASWSALTATPDFTGQTYSYGSGSDEQGWYDNVLAVDPTNANHLLAGGIALVQTTDGGTTWSNVNGQTYFGGGTNKIHPDHHALAFRSDGKVWIGDDGGVFLYTPSSGAVVNANGNLDITQFYFGFNVVGGTLLAGSQDNGSSRTTSSSLTAWTGIFSGDGGPSAITPNSTPTQFIEADQGLYVTTNGFASTPTNITPATSSLFTPPMIVVPSTTTPSDPTVFYGGLDLWRTTNPTTGATWSKVTSVGAYVSAIAVSPSNPQVVYVGFTTGAIQVSTDGGLTFTSLATQPIATNTFVTGLSVDPTNSRAITASLSFSDARYVPALPHVAQYVYTGTPASGTWTVITGNLPTDAVSHVVYDNGELVAATDTGVYATTTPAGSSTAWTRVGTGLPDVQVQDLYVAGNNIYALTHGRGAWELPGTAVVLPVITGVSPSSGPAAGGTVVSVTGTGFTGATQVVFGSTAGTALTVSSSTHLTVTSPHHSVGLVNVHVVTPGGRSNTVAADQFTYQSLPVVTAVSPTSGSAAGGTVVSVTGTGFTGATQVLFGSTAGTALTVSSATHLTVTSPKHAAGLVNVHVITPAGKSAVATGDEFTYLALPVVTGVSPVSGSHVGGTVVTVTGTGFTGATQVLFASTPGTHLTVVSSTHLTITSPAHPTGLINVHVVTPAGKSAVVAADQYTYN